MTSRGMCDEARFCLDDSRTLATIVSTRNEGIPTYVIGIDDPRDAVLIDTLDRMSTAGGRRRAGTLGYYSARSMNELSDAFESVRQSLARCTRLLSERPRDPDGLRVTIDGREIARDPTHREGWDWSETPGSEVLLFGSVCERTTDRSVVVAEERCTPPSPRDN
jgi:hypothetical protein